MKTPSLLCIGHRGAMGHEPENTLRSMRRALELGARCLEVDVYWVDGHLMVFHDDRLERTTNGMGPIMEQSFDYLRSLDAGEGEKIPTLDEVCALINGKAGLNIELKGPRTAGPVAEKVWSLTEAGWDKEAFLVSSFDHQELIHMRQLDDKLQLGVITQKARASELDFAGYIHAVSIHPAHQYVTARIVQDAHTRNIKVFAYTVNDPADIARMHDMGVDGVFTNYPERVLNHYAQGAGACFHCEP